jgi:hypothetical protein
MDIYKYIQTHVVIIILYPHIPVTYVTVMMVIVVTET